MNINKEKEYIYNLMTDIVKERRILSEMYFGLKDRLDRLIELESKGLDELDIKGYVDLQNQRDLALSLSNIKREMDKKTKQIIEKAEVMKDNMFPIEEIERMKNIDKIKNQNKKYIDVKGLIPTILSILRENVEPMQIEDLHNAIEDKIGRSIKRSNLTGNILYRARKETNKIKVINKGVYQYSNDE